MDRLERPDGWHMLLILSDAALRDKSPVPSVDPGRVPTGSRGVAETRAALGRKARNRPEAYSCTLRVGSDRGRRDATGIGTPLALLGE